MIVCYRCGLVESRVRLLVARLEKHPSIEIAPVNAASFKPKDSEP